MRETNMAETNGYVRWLDNLTNDGVPVVGGKNASLSEMSQSLFSDCTER